MSEQFYRVAARSKDQGWTGYSLPSPRDFAERLALAGNTNHPQIEHWVEPVPEVEER